MNLALWNCFKLAIIFEFGAMKLFQIVYAILWPILRKNCNSALLLSIIIKFVLIVWFIRLTLFISIFDRFCLWSSSGVHVTYCDAWRHSLIIYLTFDTTQVGRTSWSEWKRDFPCMNKSNIEHKTSPSLNLFPVYSFSLEW